MARWLRSRRGALGLSQDEVASRLAAEGVPLSRGHYANLERANYELRAEHVAVLDRILDGDGELIALADRKWDRVLAMARHAEWAELGKDLVASLLDVPPPTPPFDPSRAKEWWEAQSLNDPVVITGTAQVEEVIASLLTIASDIPEPRYAPHIEFTGAFFGFKEEGRPGLAVSVRQALRSVMELGRRCRHHIPVPTGKPADSTLVFVASPLIACRNFEARIIDPDGVSPVENLLVIPDVVAAQFFATRSADRIDAVILHRAGFASRVLEERVRQIESLSQPFVERFERSPSDDLDLTDDEKEFRRLLARVATIEGPSRMLLGWFPTPTIPKDDYAQMTAARRARARNTPSPVWNEVVELQETRVDLMEKALGKGISHQSIITREKLERFAAMEDDAHWAFADTSDVRIRRLDRILSLMENPAFEIAIANERLAQRLADYKWEVREGASRGVVVVQTKYTPLAEDAQPSSTSLPVDLMIEAPGAVSAFMAYYADLWASSLNDQDEVRKELRRARTALKKFKSRA